MCITEQIQQSNQLDWNSDPSHVVAFRWIVIPHWTRATVACGQRRRLLVCTNAALLSFQLDETSFSPWLVRQMTNACPASCSFCCDVYCCEYLIIFFPGKDTDYLFFLVILMVWEMIRSRCIPVQNRTQLSTHLCWKRHVLLLQVSSRLCLKPRQENMLHQQGRWPWRSNRWCRQWTEWCRPWWWK